MLWENSSAWAEADHYKNQPISKNVSKSKVFKRIQNVFPFQIKQKLKILVLAVH